MSNLDPNQRPKMIDSKNIGVGVFSNIVNIALTPNEVFLDFGVVVPPVVGSSEGDVTLVSRIALTKAHAAELRDVLTTTLEQATK